MSVTLLLGVRLLRMEFSTRESVGWLSTHGVGGEGGRFKQMREAGSPLSYPLQPGETVVTW